MEFRNAHINQSTELWKAIIGTALEILLFTINGEFLLKSLYFDTDDFYPSLSCTIMFLISRVENILYAKSTFTGNRTYNLMSIYKFKYLEG